MDRPTEKVMETIAKCLSLAADPGATDNEREVANRKAQQLMAKYGIDHYEAKAQDATEEDDVEVQAEEMWHPDAHWELQLAGGIARAFSCQVIKIRQPWKDTAVLHFFGMKHDLELVDYFWNYLRRTVTLFVDDDSSYASSKKSKYSYAFGMVVRITERLYDLYNYMVDALSANCKDLVVSKESKVRAAMDAAHPDAKIAKSPDYDIDAVQRGVSDADTIDLSSNRDQVEGDGDGIHGEARDLASRRNHAMMVLAQDLQAHSVTIGRTMAASPDNNMPAMIFLSDGFTIKVLNDAQYEIEEAPDQSKSAGRNQAFNHGIFQSTDSILEFLRHT